MAEDKRPFVFISYASADQDRVLPLVDALRSVDIDCWLDQQSIDGGSIYGPAIARAIRSSSALLILCSAASLTSRNVQQEIAIAWRHQRALVPLLLEPIATLPDEVEYWLEGAQWIEVFDQPVESWLPKVARALHRIEAFARDDARLDPHSRPAPRFDVPTPLAPLVDRHAELAAVRRYFETARLVTLTGPGGTGKTRLAVACAHALRAAFPDGAVVVDLSPVRDHAAVIPAIATAIGVRESGDEPMLDRLVGHVRDLRLLLVLDNMEQVIDAAPDIGALLTSCPNLHALVTSRIPLSIRGEQECPIPALPVPDRGRPGHNGGHDDDAIALFVQRASSVKPGFVLSPDLIEPVREICRKVDGLPLAIELAAARCKMLTPHVLLERLDQPLSILTGGARDLPERQRTMRAAIAWSYDLLDAGEQRLFRTLAAFVGGWTVAAVEAVTTHGGHELDIIDGLQSLLDKSLIVRRDDEGDEPRFRMLETIREFGLEQLEMAGEGHDARQRHAAYFAEHAASAAPLLELADQAAWLARLEPDEGNLAAAISWCRDTNDARTGLSLVNALRVYWFMRGRMGSGIEHITTVVSLASSDDFPLIKADALNGAAFLCRYVHDFDRAARMSAESLEISRRLADPHREADALANLGFVALQRGDYDTASRHYNDSLGIYRVIGNQQGIADTMSHLALIALTRQNVELACESFDESLTIWKKLGDQEGIVWAQRGLGMALAARGDTLTAVSHLGNCLTLSLDMRFPWGVCWALEGLVQVAATLDRPRIAAFLLECLRSYSARAQMSLPPFDLRQFQDVDDWTRATLAHDVLANAQAQGRRWTGEQGLPDALWDELGGGFGELPG